MTGLLCHLQAENRENKSIREKLKVEDKWLRRSEDLEKIIDEEDRWEKRKRKTEKEMGKGHMGCF